MRSGFGTEKRSGSTTSFSKRTPIEKYASVRKAFNAVGSAKLICTTYQKNPFVLDSGVISKWNSVAGDSTFALEAAAEASSPAISTANSLAGIPAVRFVGDHLRSDGTITGTAGRTIIILHNYVTLPADGSITEIIKDTKSKTSSEVRGMRLRVRNGTTTLVSAFFRQLDPTDEQTKNYNNSDSYTEADIGTNSYCILRQTYDVGNREFTSTFFDTSAGALTQDFTKTYGVSDFSGLNNSTWDSIFQSDAAFPNAATNLMLGSTATNDTMVYAYLLYDEALSDSAITKVVENLNSMYGL